MQKQEHPCKFADAIEAECHSCAKDKNTNTFKHAQKKQSCTEKGRIPTKLENCKQNEEHSTFIFIHLASTRAITKGKSCGTSYHKKRNRPQKCHQPRRRNHIRYSQRHQHSIRAPHKKADQYSTNHKPSAHQYHPKRICMLHFHIQPRANGHAPYEGKVNFIRLVTIPTALAEEFLLRFLLRFLLPRSFLDE